MNAGAPDVGAPEAGAPLLGISGLTVSYRGGGRHGGPPVLDGVDLEVRRGEILGVIGETGSGKTTLARAVVGLVPVSAGRIVFDGTEVSALRGRALRAFRREGRLQFAFQDPLRALDPDLTVASVVGEPLAVAPTRDRAARDARVLAALRAVGLDPALAHRPPGRISGGQRQRVLLARALVTRPRLVLCDEPVSALDAASRTHVLRLLASLRDDAGATLVVISHDLFSLAGIADRLAVLHGGRIVEQRDAATLLRHPEHPYTRRLVAAAPRLRRAPLAVSGTRSA